MSDRAPDERVTRITHAAGHCACSTHIGEVMREAFSLEKSLEDYEARIEELEAALRRGGRCHCGHLNESCDKPDKALSLSTKEEAT